jgi:ethanolamine utilization microcompartment shell protein EutS
VWHLQRGTAGVALLTLRPGEAALLMSCAGLCAFEVQGLCILQRGTASVALLSLRPGEAAWLMCCVVLGLGCRVYVVIAFLVEVWQARDAFGEAGVCRVLHALM